MHLSHSTCEHGVTQWDLCKLHQQVAQNVSFRLNREAFIVGIREVKQLPIKVGPDGARHFASQLEHSELGLAVVAVLQLVHEVLTILGYHTL